MAITEDETTISVEDLQTTTETIEPEVFTETPVSTPPIPTFETAKEEDVSAAGARITELTTGLGGQSEFTTGLELEQDIAGKEETLQGITSQLETLDAEQQIIPLELQEESFGRARTVGGAMPLEAGRLRKNAIAQLGLNASFQAAKGNLELAQSFVDRAVAAEFDPIREQLAIEQANLNTLMQMPDLTAAEKQQAAQAQAEIDAEKVKVEAEANTRESIQKLAMEARTNGASETEVQAILDSQTIDEAIVASTGFVSDTTKLDLEMKQLQIDKLRTEMRLLSEPSEAELKATEEAMQNAQASILVMNDKLTAIDLLKESEGISSRVGTTALDRTTTGFLGGFAKLTSGIGTKSALDDIRDKISGEGQDFAGGVHQLVSGLGLDALIAAKARGATFGALSDAELKMLANSATKINDWEIRDENNKPTGIWNIDEQSFQDELDNIKMLTQRAVDQSGQSIITEEEDSLLDNLYPEATTPASAYFQ